MTAAAGPGQPQAIVDLARSTMHTTHTDLAGAWPRASAILGRQALELALDQLWLRVAQGVQDTPMRAQLLCLSAFLEPELTSRVRYAWYGLSAACHYHAYELPPVVSELEGWLDEVEKLIDEVSGPEPR